MNRAEKRRQQKRAGKAAKRGSEAGVSDDLAEALNLAVQHHQAGRLQEAEGIYRKVLQADPNQPNTLNLLGMLAHQVGQTDVAVGLLTQATQVMPEFAEAQNNLGNALKDSGKLSEAIASYCKAIEINPGFAEAHYNLGIAQKDTDDLESAVASYDAAILINPDYVKAHYNQGVAHFELGDLTEAVSSYENALAINADYVEALSNLGNVLRDLGRFDEAIVHCRKAIALNSNFIEAQINLGSALQGQGKFDEAVDVYQKLIVRQPESLLAHNNLGAAYLELGQFDQAEEHCRQAIELRPDFVEAHINLAEVLQEVGRLDEALTSYREAIEIDPNNAEAHKNLGTCLLLSGDLRDGAAEYEWRFSAKNPRKPPNFVQPLWDGSESLRGRRLVIWGEQGVGDEILHASMYPDHLAAGVELVLSCDPRLIALFERSFQGATCLPRNGKEAVSEDEYPEFDFHIAAASQIQRMRPDMNSFPERISYLVADEVEKTKLRNQYKNTGDNLLVGIAWESKVTKYAQKKTMSLEKWLPILSVPGITFVNLQYGDTAHQRTALEAETGIEILHDASVDPLLDIDRAASQIAAMDLVISTSNAAVHIAGALGVPVWIMLPVHPFWYWMAERIDSPWYPSARLFRQTCIWEWEDVADHVGAELAKFKA